MSRRRGLLLGDAPVRQLYWPLCDCDAGFCRQARDDLFTHTRDAVRVKKDFDRNALNDLNEVAGGVIGWQQSEIRPGAGLKAVDTSGKAMMGHGVNLDFHGLTYLVFRYGGNRASITAAKSAEKSGN